MLVYYFSENRKKNLKDIYEGKYSIKPEIEDEKIYKTAINLTHKNNSITSKLVRKKKIGKNINLKANYKSVLLEPRFDLRVNNLNSRDDVIKLLSKNNIPSVESKFSQLGITILKELRKKINKIKSGAFEIQDEGSQIVTILSGAKSGEKVLDYCAGKGTKTIALYEQMQGIGSLYAYDENQKINLFKQKVRKTKIK